MVSFTAETKTDELASAADGVPHDRPILDDGGEEVGQPTVQHRTI